MVSPYDRPCSATADDVVVSHCRRADLGQWMTSPMLRYEVDEGLAWITINRPERYNAFRARTVDELVMAFIDLVPQHR